MGCLIDIERKSQLNFGPMLWFSTLTLPITLTLNFQCQILIDMERKGYELIRCYTYFVTLSYDFDLGFSRSNSENAVSKEWRVQLTWKQMDVSDTMLDSHCDLELWPHSWPFFSSVLINLWSCFTEFPSFPDLWLFEQFPISGQPALGSISKLGRCIHYFCPGLIIPPAQRSCWGVYWFHSIRPSVPRPSRIPCPLCSFYSSGWIHFIFIHLIKQLQKVCRVQSFLQNLKIWSFGSFF